ncbi:peptide deformylase [Gimibacter soli]|uniref:Peptide deformylase n=1 Tax=Gimibacter soli TaxID=3024400 RepID=A0AAE9XNZ7_9PROT|nr:peptide deformylase [Gimibacter soli]WCL54522.1 peptide deformylase [Gimibacter soli]
MAKLNIIHVPDPVLRTISDPVEEVNDAVRRTLDDMVETMYAAPGIGLAAIQVGIPRRMLVIDTEGDEANPKPKFLINPEVVWESDDYSVYNEGCLSVPEHYAEVERPATVRIRYVDYHGKQVEEEMDGLLATCAQHEIDHLNGVVFIDHLSKLKRNMIVKKLLKASKDVEIL